MSRQNRVNPDHYKTAGRLTQDDLARERRKQSESQMGAGRAQSRKASPPWMANFNATGDRGEQQHVDARVRPAETQDVPAAAHRAAPKEIGSRATTKAAKASRAREAATGASSAKRAGKPSARKAVVRGAKKAKTKKVAAKRAPKTGAKSSAKKAGAKKSAAKKGAAKESSVKKAKRR